MADDVVVSVEGQRVKMSNLDKVLYPNGFSKAEVINFYSRIAPFALPHLTDRPVTMEVLKIERANVGKVRADLAPGGS